METNLTGTNPSIGRHPKTAQVATPKWEQGYSGEDNPRHILTAEQVLEIYASTEPQMVLAKRYGVSRQTISMIRHGKRWTWLTQGRTEVGAA